MPVEASAQWVDELRKTLPELPAVKAARLQKEWGLTDLEMRDIEGNEGALALIEATVVAGADQAAARKWWLGELSRRANETEVELAELPISPVQVAQVGKLVDSGKLTDKMARQVIEAVLAGRANPPRSSRPADWRSSPMTTRSRAPWTRPLRPTRAWRTRSVAGRSRPPEPSSVP